MNLRATLDEGWNANTPVAVFHLLLGCFNLREISFGDTSNWFDGIFDG